MRTRVWSKAVLAAVLAATAAPAWAQAPASMRYGDPAHPDLSGLWRPDQSTTFADVARAPLPLTPAYGKRLAEARRMMEAGTPLQDSVSRCIAFGTPRFMTIPFEAVQTPGQLTLISQVFHDVRRIYTDGAGHTPAVDPSWNGDSVGRWDGDTLVVETVALKAGTVDIYGVAHSDKLTVVERIRSPAPGKLEVEFTLTDPEAFTRTWVVKRTYTRLPAGERFEEYVCENERNGDGDVQR